MKNANVTEKPLPGAMSPRASIKPPAVGPAAKLRAKSAKPKPVGLADADLGAPPKRRANQPVGAY